MSTVLIADDDCKSSEVFFYWKYIFFLDQTMSSKFARNVFRLSYWYTKEKQGCSIA